MCWLRETRGTKVTRLLVMALVKKEMVLQLSVLKGMDKRVTKEKLLVMRMAVKVQKTKAGKVLRK